MTSPDFHSLKRHLSIKPASIDFKLAPESPLSLQSRKSGHEESYKRMKTVIEPGSEKEVRLEKPRSARDAWRQIAPWVSTGLTLSQMLPKQPKLQHVQCQGPVLDTTPVRYEMGRNPTEVDVKTVFKRNGRLPSVFQEEIWILAGPCWFVFPAVLLSAESTTQIFSSQLKRLGF